MKSILKWIATISIIGGAILGSVTLQPNSALALTDDDVRQVLQTVPVFALTDAEGNVLIVEDADASVMGIFINPEDAEEFLDTVAGSNASSVEGVQITPVSLADVYDMAVQERDNGLVLDFIPDEEQVANARELLATELEDSSQFNEVPLFVTRFSEAEGTSYLTIGTEDTEVIPIFFSIEQLQGTLDQLESRDPSLNFDDAEVEVLSLEQLINNLETSDDPSLTNIELVPLADTINYLGGEGTLNDEAE